MLTLAPQTLGNRLQSEREIRGFTLEHISASTKIPIPLLEALERGDLSRWPKGIYRRAFFRAYVTALGLPAEPLTGEFARLFPDDTALEPRAATVAAPSPPATTPSEPVATASTAQRGWRRVLLALVEVAAVVAAGSLVAWAAGMSLLTASGAVALVYYPAMRAVGGRIRRSSSSPHATAATTASTTAPPSLTLAAPRSRLASARMRLGHLHTYVDARVRPRAGRIVRHTNHVLGRAGTRTGHALGHGASVAGRASGIVISWTTVVLRHTDSALRRTGILFAHAGTAVGRGAGHVGRHAARVSSRALDEANQAFWRVVRVAAEQAQLLAARQLNRSRE